MDPPPLASMFTRGLYVKGEIKTSDQVGGVESHPKKLGKDRGGGVEGSGNVRRRGKKVHLGRLTTASRRKPTFWRKPLSLEKMAVVPGRYPAGNGLFICYI